MINKYKSISKNLTLALILIFISTGCNISYIFHAAVGQFRLLNDSVPVEEGLKGDLLTSDQKDRLRLVAKVKEFGIKSLGLTETQSYRTVYLKSSDRPIYVVSASPKDSLSPVTWWFPIVGRMPYLGFFDREKAVRKKGELIKENLDVILGLADAYSTLGWFEDPVTFNLLKGSDLDLVETILHEMTHSTLYVKGESEFNESLAVIIGRMGAWHFFKDTFGPGHSFTVEAMKAIEDERIFSAFLSSLLLKLERLYQSPISYHEKLIRRETIFKLALDEFSQTQSTFRTDRFLFFGKSSINNAYLISIGLYHRHFLLFEKVLEEKRGSLKAMLDYCRKLADEKNDIINNLKNTTPVTK